MPEHVLLKQTISLIIRLLPTNSFARGVSMLVGGSALAQAITVLVAPLLTRLYSPQDFGMLAVFVAMVSLPVVVAAARYEVAIPIPDDENEAAALLVLSMLLLLATTALATIPILLLRNEIAVLFRTPTLAEYLYLLPLAILLAGAFSILNYWALRLKAFAPIAKTKISQAVATTGMQLGGASFGAAALLLGQVAGQAMGMVSLWQRVLRPQWPVISSVKLRDMVLMAGRYKKFPLFSTWGALFNTAGVHLPPIMFAALFSPAAAGIYVLANRVLSLPLQLLGQEVAKVFYSNAAQAHRDGTLQQLVESIHGKLAQIGLPPILLLLIAGPDIFQQVFGADWREAGAYAQWMSCWLYLVFITSPLASLFEVLDRQAAGMAYQAVLLSVRVASITVGAWIGDITIAVALFALGSAVCWLATLTRIIRLSGNSLADIFYSTLGALAWALALVSPMLLTVMRDGNQGIWIFSIAGTSVLIAARYIYLMKDAWA